MLVESFGKLFNEQGEIVAEGSCQIDTERGSVTMRPLVDTALLSRQKGTLRLELDDGSHLLVSDRIIRFRLNVPGVPPGPAYRLFVVGAQQGSAGGAV